MPKVSRNKKAKTTFNVARLRAKSRVDFTRLKSKSRADFTNRRIRFADLESIDEDEDEFELQLELEVEEAMEEQEMEEQDIDSQKSLHEASVEMEEEEEEDEDQFVREIDASSTDLVDSETEVSSRFKPKERRPTMKKKADFFDLLGQVPNIDEISLSESVSTDIAVSTVEETDETVEEAAEEADEVEKIEYFEDEFTSEYSELDYEIVYSDEDELTLGQQKEEYDIFEDMYKETVVMFKEHDPTLEARLEVEIILKKDTWLFLNSLIRAVVDIAEYVDPEEVLRQNLDKVKLFKELMRLLDEIFGESKALEFFNTKCIQHYRRVRDFRPITPETEEIYSSELKKYHEALDKLNCLLNNQTQLKETLIKKINEAEKLKREMKQRAKLLSSDWESTMRRIFNTRSGNIVKGAIERGILEMKNLRLEISNVRQTLIKRQHISGTLLKKIFNLYKVSEKFDLRDYEHITDEEYRLTKKLEEKSTRLIDVFNTFNSHTSSVAHIREKQCMFLHAMHSQERAYIAADSEKRNLRTYIHKLKMDRIKVQKDIGESHLEIGLIGKPALLRDFDETVERGQKLKRKVDAMKEKIHRLENKMSFLEKRTCN